jgi:hypothetical protein
MFLYGMRKVPANMRALDLLELLFKFRESL